MAAYRLVEYGGGTRGPREFPRIYPTVDDALEAAEHVLVALADVAWRRPFRVDVYDVWTRETVTSLRPDDTRDPDVCPVCHAPRDPFAPALPAAGGRPGTETDMALPAAPSLPGLTPPPPPVPSTAPGDGGAGPTATGAGPTLVCECGAPLEPGETRCGGCRRFDRFMDAPR